MNAIIAVSSVTMTKCDSCGHVVPNGLVGEPCKQSIETISMGRRDCEGRIILTNGEKFKRQYGYSKTHKRNMSKQGLNPSSKEDQDSFKELRRERKRKLRSLQKNRHETKRAQRSSKK